LNELKFIKGFVEQKVFFYILANYDLGNIDLLKFLIQYKQFLIKFHETFDKEEYKFIFDLEVNRQIVVL
jgi:hypothetical protein